MKFSIVIPTYNHCDDLLKPCVKSILKNTDFENGEFELIIVANGCTDGTKSYIDSLKRKYQEKVQLIWVDDPIGFTKATNAGMKAIHEESEYVILMNNDSQILDYKPKNTWIEMLEKPFLKDEMVGLTGPAKRYDQYTKKKFLIFFLVMISKKTIEKIGYLDEIFSPGYGEDIDYCFKAKKAGLKFIQVPDDNREGYETEFPIYHMAEGTMHSEETDWEKIGHENNWNKIVQRNTNILQERYPQEKISVIIPTYNHCDDLLRPCIESIVKYTSPDTNLELVISANGCTDNTEKYIKSLSIPFEIKVAFSKEPLGYTKATNEGIKIATGDYIVLLNNDIVLLEQSPNTWLDILRDPLDQNMQVGLTGPILNYCPYTNRHFLIFFCVMIRKKLFEELGLLDEIFSPGFGEDTDFCIRAEEAGYKLVQVPVESEIHFGEGNLMVGNFPIFHKGEETLGEMEETNELLERNRKILASRYRRPFKLNLGCGDRVFDDYINIDWNSEKALFRMDMRNLDFLDESVDEILALHSFEHISPYEISQMLHNWFSKLKPGGKLIMELPNIEKICEQFKDSNKEKRYELLNCIYGTTQIEHPHLFGWYDEILKDHLEWAGFKNISFPEEQVKDHWGINFRVEAEKEDLMTNLPQGWFELHDVKTYRELISSIPNDSKILEIGVWKGRSLCSIADLIKEKNLKVIAVDTFEGTKGNELEEEAHKEATELDLRKEFKQNIKLFEIEKNVTILKTTSVLASKKFKENEFNFIFLDGDHSFEAVTEDVIHWYPKLKSGGIFAGHDYAWESVREAIYKSFKEMIYNNGTNQWFLTKRRIYDGFIFFNELDALEIRLNELNDIVDKFILVESTKTHSGQSKPLYFERNKERFSKFLHKIDHIIVNDGEMPKGNDFDSNWTRESFQRDAIMRGWKDCNDSDVVMVSDIDEIPSAKSISKFNPEKGLHVFEQSLNYYYLNMREVNNEEEGKWNWAKILPFSLAKNMTPSQIRYTEATYKIEDGGWHFSYLGGTQKIIEKIESYSHQEYNNDKIKKNIESRVEKGEDIFERGLKFQIINLDTLPTYVIENKEKFKHLINESNSNSINKK